MSPLCFNFIISLFSLFLKHPTKCEDMTQAAFHPESLSEIEYEIA